MAFRNKNFTLGFQFGHSEISLPDVSRYNKTTDLFEIKLGYEDVYSLQYKNPHNFVNYFGAQIYGGVSKEDDESNLFALEGYRIGFRLMRGIGYQLDNTFVIPYLVGGMNRQFIDIDRDELSPEYENSYIPQEKLYSGSHREAGVMIQLANGVGFSLAFNNNMYSKKTAWLPRMGSSAIEYAVTFGVSKGIYHLCKDSKLFPVYDFISRTAMGLIFLSLKRKEAYYPFGGSHDFSMNSVKVGFNYRINVGW